MLGKVRLFGYLTWPDLTHNQIFFDNLARIFDQDQEYFESLFGKWDDNSIFQNSSVFNFEGV